MDRQNYDQTIEYLETALRRAKVREQDKVKALRRLRQTHQDSPSLGATN